MEEDFFIFFMRNVDCFSVPASGDEITVANAGAFAFGAEGNENGLFKLFFVLDASRFAGFSKIEFKLPFSAEIDPLFAYKLGTRVCVSCIHGATSFSFMIEFGIFRYAFVVFMVSQKPIYVNGKIDFEIIFWSILISERILFTFFLF